MHSSSRSVKRQLRLHALLIFIAVMHPAGGSAQVRSLAWDHVAGADPAGYAVYVDGVRTDYGRLPTQPDGSCGCFVPATFIGARHTIVVSAYNASGETRSEPFVVGPTANAGGPYQGLTGSVLTVDGARSVDRTSTIARYSWSWGDGTGVTTSISATATHVYARHGTYAITLTVSDEDGASHSAATTALIADPAPTSWRSEDIGLVGRAGAASLAGGTFTVSGGGADIWGTGDAFHFLSQAVSGDVEIVARVTGITNTHGRAKAGVMLRESAAAGSRHVLLNVCPDGRIELLSRASPGGTTVWTGSATQTLPSWLRLTRRGTTVTASISFDGSTWIDRGTVPIAMPTAAYLGLAVTSHDLAMLNVATFDHVDISSASTPPTPEPSPSAAGNIVIYARDVQADDRHGAWQIASDSTSPDGLKLITPDDGLANTSSPLARPIDYVEATFSATAGTPYRVWLRLRALDDNKFNDSVWVQFSDAMANGSPVYQIDTTSGLMVNLATDVTAGSLDDWGWHNTAYWMSQPTTVTFQTNGTHTIRVQPREDGVQLDQIVLSPDTYLTAPPGPVQRDLTIVPKP
jgi:PKD repeat protein